MRVINNKIVIPIEAHGLVFCHVIAFVRPATRGVLKLTRPLKNVMGGSDRWRRPDSTSNASASGSNSKTDEASGGAEATRLSGESGATLPSANRTAKQNAAKSATFQFQVQEQPACDSRAVSIAEVLHRMTIERPPGLNPQ